VHVSLTVKSAYGLSRVAVYSYTAIPAPFIAVVAAVLIGAAAALGLLAGTAARPGEEAGASPLRAPSR
jgi:hypothetical protein